MSEETVGYFLYYARTYHMVRTPDELRGYVLNLSTGDFDLDTQLVNKINFATTQEIYTLDLDEFIDETEKARHHYLTGNGPIFAVYDTIDSIYKQAKAEGRRINQQELVFVTTLRKRTFKMWEEEFSRRKAGEPAQNTYTARTFGASATSDTTTEGSG